MVTRAAREKDRGSASKIAGDLRRQDSVSDAFSLMDLLGVLCLVVAAPLPLARARVDLGGGHMGLAMANTCRDAHVVSCSELDDDWPDQGMACPLARHDIPRHTLALMSATMIQLGKYAEVAQADFPVEECYTSAPNSTVSSYGFISQGTFDMWFFAHDKCDCTPGNIPVCHEHATEAEKCNLRTFTLCKVTKKPEICTPKHHPGWKPLPPIPVRNATQQSNSSDFSDEEPPTQVLSVSPEVALRFSPAHRQQAHRFHDPSGVWCKVMELLGFWGAV